MSDITPEELEELKRLTAIATQEHHTEESIYEFVLEPLGCAFACAVLNAAPALIRSEEELGRVRARLADYERVLNQIANGCRFPQDDVQKAILKVTTEVLGDAYNPSPVRMP